MSRIDEALARARSVRPEDLSAPEVSPVSDGQHPVAFPLEAVESDEAVAVPAAEQTPMSFEAGAVIDEPTDTKVVDVEAHVEDLPIAEKLMLSSQTPGAPAAVEQYRRLAARLCMAQAEHGIGVVMVTSALPGEGKTLTATNLALTLSESYKRSVLLIDADLRRPCVHQVFQVPNASGLNDGLRSGDDRKVPLMQFSDRLTLLTAGRPDSDPMSILSGDRMKRVIDEAKTRFEWVIVDTPPVGLLTDAHLLSAIVDTVVFVVRAGYTPLPAINGALQSVGRDRVLGVVLNHAEIGGLPGSYHAYNYYGSYRAGT
jgi:capsular exopolysaccharide synthesis family protein